MKIINNKLLYICIFLVSCGHLFYYPTENNYSTPKQFGVEYSEQFLDLYYGSIRYFHLKPKVPNKTTIIFFHGNADNISGHFRQMIPLAKNGYDIFMYDYPGYGKSSGQPTREGIFYYSQIVLEDIIKQHKKLKNKKLIVYGQSLGGNIAFSAVANFKKQDLIDLLIVDASFSSYKQVGFDRLKSHWLTFFVSPLAYLLVNNDYSANKYIEHFKNKKTKILFIHSKQDMIVPYYLGKEFYEEVQGDKSFLSLNSSCHLCGLIEPTSKDEILKKISQLLH